MRKKEQKSQVRLIRWSLAMAAAEFGLGPKTVATRVKAAGIVPGKDGRFSTAEIHGAICGDYEKERTRKMKEDADKAALENAVARGQLVDKGDFMKRFEGIYAEMRQGILGSAMPDSDKDALLNKLARVHSV